MAGAGRNRAHPPATDAHLGSLELIYDGVSLHGVGAFSWFVFELSCSAGRAGLARPAAGHVEPSPARTCLPRPQPSRNHYPPHPRRRCRDLCLGTEREAPRCHPRRRRSWRTPQAAQRSRCAQPGRLRPRANSLMIFGSVAEPGALPKAVPVPAP